jgi:hypothetical membrane protein
MNAGILVSGITVTAGAWLSGPSWPEGLAVRAGLALLFIGGIGSAMVGLWPLDSSLGLHVAGAALTLGAGNVGMILMGAGLTRARPVLGTIGFAGGLLAVTAFGLFACHVDFGAGPGMMERVAAYPKTVWLALAGAALVAGALRGRQQETGRS